MSVSPDGPSATPASPSYDHMCQNGCGRPADLVLVELTSSTTDILCRTCTMGMWVAIAAKLTADMGEDAAEGLAASTTP